LKGKEIKLSSLDKDRTALFVVDMVNGFVHSGALARRPDKFVCLIQHGDRSGW